MSLPQDRILIVEDDQPLQDVLGQALAKEGYEVRTATNGQEALAYLERGFLPAVVVVDIRMPKMDGFTFLVEMKRKPFTAHIPAIGMSALKIKGEDAEIFDGWINKPLNLDALLKLISDLIALSRRRLAEQETKKTNREW